MSIAFSALLEAIAPDSSDTIVLLGDLIDRGPNSSSVIATAIGLTAQCNVICVLGDHEELMLNAIEDNDALPNWLRNGGVETLQSYGWTGNESGSLGLASQAITSRFSELVYPTTKRVITS